MIVREEMIDYVAALVRATRADLNFALGASPRAGVMLLRAAKANAAIEGRDFVLPEDVQEMWLPVLRHRVSLDPAAEVEGLVADQALRAHAAERDGAAMRSVSRRAAAAGGCRVPSRPRCCSWRGPGCGPRVAGICVVLAALVGWDAVLLRRGHARSTWHAPFPSVPFVGRDADIGVILRNPRRAVRRAPMSSTRCRRDLAAVDPCFPGRPGRSRGAELRLRYRVHARAAGRPGLRRRW